MAEWKLKRGDEEYVAENFAKVEWWARNGMVRPGDYIYNPVLDRWMYARDMPDVAPLITYRDEQPAATNLAVHGKSEGLFLQGMNCGCAILIAFVVLLIIFYVVAQVQHAG
jgi:hypothetical protein